MSEIIKNLYLGNHMDAKNIKDVDLVINCTSDIPFYIDDNVKKIRISVEDNGDEKEYKKLYDIIENNNIFYEIDKMLLDNKIVLCHCAAGQQRSPAVIACYLSWKTRADIFKIINFIKKKRPIAFFNAVNFLSTINHYSRSLPDKIN